MLLLGSYSRARPHEPEIYTNAIAATLAGYPAEVIEHVTDPRTGLQRTLKWLPEVAEVVEACEAESRRLAWAAKAEQIIAERASRPKAIEPPPDPERDAKMRKRFEELVKNLQGSLTDPFVGMNTKGIK